MRLVIEHNPLKMTEFYPIVLLEDDLFFQLRLEQMLDDTEFKITKIFEDTTGIRDYLEENRQTIFICDLFIDRKPKGLQLIKTLNLPEIPVIGITNSVDRQVFNELKPYVKHYLIKPFHKLTLLSTLTVINEELRHKLNKETSDNPLVFLRTMAGHKELVYLTDIVYIEASGNYITLTTTGNKTYVEKISLTRFMEDHTEQLLIRIHHKFAVNRLYIRKISSKEVQLTTGRSLPVSYTFKSGLDYLESTQGKHSNGKDKLSSES